MYSIVMVRALVAHVAQALELQRHLLVQAGTGTGKSLGYLVPALARVGESDQPIVVATATLALQAQIVDRDLPRVAEALRKTATPFGVNLSAQAAAIASLEAKDELDVRVKGIVAERERVLAALREAGWQMTDSQANFVWFPLGERTADFVAACTEAGLSVRPYGSDGVRVTIGETEANDRLIEVAREFLRAAS